ncbi:MAG: hypothetical protein NT018_05905 [Armatimonadetes bacterium]|nr:hypothetical protein [Armatimonadota bacterium]
MMRLITGLFIGYMMSFTGDVSEDMSGSWRCLWAISGAFFVDYVCRLLFQYEQRLPQEAAEKVKEQVRILIESVEKQLDRFSPYFGVHTEHNVLENILLSSHSIDTKAKWVVPFFVSRKLKDDFKSRNQIDFQLLARDYSELLADLIPNCSSTLHMTCPYIPTTWFKEVFASESEMLKAAMNNTLSEQNFPSHVATMMRLRVSESKKRFVVIPDEDNLAQFWHPDNRDALLCFLRFSNSDYDIQTRFAYLETLCGECRKCSLAALDFQVWDSKVAVEWRKSDTTCTMKIGLDTHYLDFFGKCFMMSAATYSATQLKEKLVKIEKGDTVIVWERKVNNTGLIGGLE